MAAKKRAVQKPVRGRKPARTTKPAAKKTARPAARVKVTRSGKKKINLALQGGGAHGAFAWGVIDRLLEDDRLEIDGIVGTSAGAMNAAVTAYGLALGGPEMARAKLQEFWARFPTPRRTRRCSPRCSTR